jgi:hypothetical protein
MASRSPSTGYGRVFIVRGEGDYLREATFHFKLYWVLWSNRL